MKIQVLIWFIAILSSSPYFYITIRHEQHCYFDPSYQSFVKICFYISATCFFVLPAFILCVLYALMARRLYSVGLFNEVRWSKASTAESSSPPMDLQRPRYHSTGLEQIPQAYRHSSTASVLTRYSFIPRSTKTSLGTFSTQVQSMKKSAFKMLCKYIIEDVHCF